MGSDADPKILRKSDNDFRHNRLAFLDHKRSLRGNGVRRAFREMKLWIGENRFKLMKKNDILRVRVDVATLTALQRACADSGCSLSHILRESIVHELARRDGRSGGPAPNKYRESIADAGSDARSACAWLLSSILVGPQPPPRECAEQWQRKQRRVSQLVEALFRAIGVPPDHALPDHALPDYALPDHGHPTHAHSVILGTDLEATGIVGPAVAYMLGAPDPAADGGGHAVVLDQICTT
jgi:hypothetical protein